MGSIEGTQRITIPVIFGVLTTICTFLPMLQGVGSSGQIGAVIATVVICCLIFSLIESQLILPAHLGNKQTKTARSEVYLLLVPLMVIVLLQFSWSTSSFVGLAIALMTVVYALDRLGLTDVPAKRLIAAQSRFRRSRGADRWPIQAHRSASDPGKIHNPRDGFRILYRELLSSVAAAAISFSTACSRSGHCAVDDATWNVVRDNGAGGSPSGTDRRSHSR